MFWTDWGLFYPKIERADLSGENRRVVVDLAFWYFYLNQLFPMSVVIDYEAERIYWMDAYDNYIDSTDYNGYNWRTVHYVSHNIFPADLALYGDKEDGKEKTGASLPSPARSLSGLVTSPSRFSLAFVPNEASKQDPYYGTDITVLTIF